MFLPLSDDNPRRRTAIPIVTWALIAVNVGAFALTGGVMSPQAAHAAMLGLGVIPALVTDNATLSPELVLVPEAATFLTYQFLHGGLFHLAGNMLFLWVFGDNVEDAMGHMRFLVFYLLCGIAGAFAHLGIHPASQAPLIGASGAVSGVLAAYLLLFPRVRVFGLAMNVLPVSIPVWLAIGAYIAVQIVQVVAGMATRGGQETAWWAHIGGLLAGAALVGLFKRSDVRLFCNARALSLTVPRMPLRAQR